MKMSQNYEALVQKFVALYSGRARQRSAEWLALKQGSIGGSEIAALMGKNPYSTFEQVVGEKSGVRARGGGSIACWWGTMFESAIERYVEIDCGLTLAGTDISVPSPETSGLSGLHSNSPDGYGVVQLFLNDDGEWQLLTTDIFAENRIVRRAIALLEFKCPFRRWPKGDIPKQYKPQIWSGLALSPIAHVGMFVDAVFRKCSLDVLGASPEYDREYHRERVNERWTMPVAWGLTGIYAPIIGTQKMSGAASTTGEEFDLENLPTSASHEAWRIYYAELGHPGAPKADEPYRPDPIDFGLCSKQSFETTMGLLDCGLFTKVHYGPCFSDGRGYPLRTGAEIGRAVDGLRDSAPDNCYLLGVVPWKMYEVCYSFLERRCGFLDEIRPLVVSCLGHVAEIRGSNDPSKAYHSFLSARRPVAEKSDLAEEEVLDLFAAVAAAQCTMP